MARVEQGKVEVCRRFTVTNKIGRNLNYVPVFSSTPFPFVSNPKKYWELEMMLLKVWSNFSLSGDLFVALNYKGQ